jgi:hypothetical protein
MAAPRLLEFPNELTSVGSHMEEVWNLFERRRFAASRKRP